MIEIKKIENDLPKNIKKIFFGKHFLAEVEQINGNRRYLVKLSDLIESLSQREREEIEFLKEEVPESCRLEGFAFTSDEAREVCELKRRA
jgi:hypothetical protein